MLAVDTSTQKAIASVTILGYQRNSSKATVCDSEAQEGPWLSRGRARRRSRRL